MISQR